MPDPAPRSRASDERPPRRLVGATLLLALGRQWGSLCTFVGLAILSRALPLEEFGRYTFFLALFAFFDVLADGGTSTLVLQRGTTDPWAFTAHLASGRRVRALFAVVTWFLFTLGLLLGDEPQSPWLAVGAAYLFTRPLELSAVVFQRDLAWGRPVALRALVASLRVLGLLFLVLLGVRDAAPLVLLHGAGLALANLLLHFAARGRLPRPTVPVARARGVLLAALPFGAAGLLQQAYFYVDNLFVRGFAGDAELGLYNAAVRVFSFSILFATLGTGAALPWLVRRHAEGDLGRALGYLLLPSVALGGLIAGGLGPWSETVASTLFGPDFQDTGDSLRLLLVATLGVHVGAVLLTGLVAAGRGRAVLGVAAVGLVLNLLGNLLLVPAQGAPGAALATAVTEGTVALLAGALLLRRGLLSPRDVLPASLALAVYPVALGISTFLR